MGASDIEPPLYRVDRCKRPGPFRCVNLAGDCVVTACGEGEVGKDSADYRHDEGETPGNHPLSFTYLLQCVVARGRSERPIVREAADAFAHFDDARPIYLGENDPD